jgi:ADP-ribose pyrophosphatase YjhB (NUDIX family)
MDNTALKESIAVVLRSPVAAGKILLVQRPEDDPELPGVWGLPAVSLRAGETDREALERLFRTKLGIEPTVARFCCEGEQQRPTYRLRMRLYEAVLPVPAPSLPPRSASSDVTLYSTWRWGTLQELQPAADAGSLCAQLALRCYAE